MIKVNSDSSLFVLTAVYASPQLIKGNVCGNI